MIFWSKKSCDLNHSDLLISDYLLYNTVQCNEEIELLLYMFNQFHYIFNHLLLNKQDTDSHTVCNVRATCIYGRVLSTEKSKLMHSAFQNLTFNKWFHWFIKLIQEDQF